MQRLEAGEEKSLTCLCPAVPGMDGEAGTNSIVEGLGAVVSASTCHQFIYCPENLGEWLSFFFLWPHPQHMEVPRPGIESKLQRQPMLQQ